jgi:NTP pyrophosphatase (non-canonical NTP hydrolase)
METDELIKKVIRWGRDKGLNDPKAQLNKVMGEVGEIAHEVSRNRYGEEFRDAIGDTLVTILILADIASARPIGCLELAYREIKDRKGKTENGTFIKEENG